MLRSAPPPRPLAARAAAFWPNLVVFAIGCLAYGGAAGVYFLKDDLALSLLTDGAGRPDFRAFVANFLWPAGLTHDQFWRPLPVLFAWFDLNVFGVDEAAFRVCNIGFHGVNGVFVALLVNQLTGFRRPAAGLFAGLLFALHPLHGEAVLWITQRMVVMCATFSLLALIALESYFATRRKLALTVCVLASIAAAATKEVTMTLPVGMAIIAFSHPSGDRATRIRRTLGVIVLGGALACSILVLRRVIFGTWVGTYAKLAPSEYAEQFRVFERLPKSLLDGFWAVNAAEVPPRVRAAFGIAWLVFLALAVARLVQSLSDSSIRRGAVIFLGFAAASFLPTISIFYIEPTLTNGRFLYQPLAGIVGLLMVGFTIPATRRPLLRLAAPAALTILFALAGQINLRAFAGADTQIRATREGIEHHVRQVPGDPVVVVYGAPTGHHGVVTLDQNLALSMRPPFVAPPGLDVVPLISGLERTWPDRVPEVRRLLAKEQDRPRRVLHLVAASSPDRVSLLIGPLAPSTGGAPPEILAPADGALIIHPAEEPTFVFRPSPGAAGYRLHFAYDESHRLAFDLDPARHLRRAGTNLLYQLKNGHAGPDPVSWAEHSFHPPLPVAWSIEALDGKGRSLGRSATRAIVLVTTNVPG